MGYELDEIMQLYNFLVNRDYELDERSLRNCLMILSNAISKIDLLSEISDRTKYNELRNNLVFLRAAIESSNKNDLILKASLVRRDLYNLDPLMN